MFTQLENELTLSDDAVHVWSVSLDILPMNPQVLHETLAPDERDQASQFHFLKDQKQFIAVRGLLRHILSLYIHREAAHLRFCRNAFGKPELRRDANAGAEEVRFNYSHSPGLALFAFARNKEVGIDVERVQSEIAAGTIPENFFNRSEVSALRALPARFQPEAFFNCWTRKEAYVKARGEGFRIPLNSFEVFPDRAEVTDGKGCKWFLHSFVPAPGYVAALAAEGQGCRTRFIESGDWPVHLQ